KLDRRTRHAAFPAAPFSQIEGFPPCFTASSHRRYGVLDDLLAIERPNLGIAGIKTRIQQILRQVPRAVIVRRPMEELRLAAAELTRQIDRELITFLRIETGVP